MKLRAFGAAGALGFALITCATPPAFVYECDPYADADGSPCPPPDCPGECVPATSNEWSPPRLVWFGNPEEEPPCPEQASVIDYKGFADLHVPDLQCPTCQCEPSTGTCSPPRKFTFNLHACNLPGPTGTTFYAPTDWDGTCDATNQIPPGLVCPVGTDCMASVHLGAVKKTDSCTAVEMPQPTPEATSPQWQTLALVCGGSPPAHESACHNPAQTCAAVSMPAAANFRRCVYKRGENDCPAGSYIDKHTFYDRYNDARSCSACKCSPPKDSGCIGWMKFFKDPSCTGIATGHWVAQYKEPEDENQMSCDDFPLNLLGSLASKQLESMDYIPGTCEPSGGEPEGEVIPTDPTTICCIPEEPEAPAP
ncbi:hypothetical protein [Polyangium aurulentum]|uniref:hypothetical protein n=1 Tax=Polyangium aurulentum TaxID=2567896 RepID=UPI0010AE72A3|nr:hypothetical protein [Polyangium aurulentum]UQA61676.1 hypothetical protein E8A73_014875 [Polyangium aurulentum]